MKSLMKLAVATASLMGAALMASQPANAQVHIGVGIGGPDVHVGVGIGGPGPAYYYGSGYYPPGPCDAYTSYYAGDCGYSVYNGPIVLGGISVGGPHYYRWSDGRPYFWYRGGWQTWNGWDRTRFAWDRGEGFGWRGGHWDRGWGNAHWRGARRDFREDRRDFRDDRRDFREDRREDRRDEHHDDHGDRGRRGDHDR
ncbi:MAG TPA: hypothetical protein VGI89_07300 [Rhizomicrobium sp.]